ncbi:MAG: T9SS type A sorting domain-containing protein, partial [Bacteroidia bacterium]|nr:T9SS type A sorting domain-containing protein [Bacteroidia bacterium]
SALNGTTRTRVIMKYNGAPTECETFSYGEVEDYTVNIVSGKQLSSIAPVVSQNLAFRIYPNPTSDVATIDFEIEDPSNATLISVYDIHGKLLMVESIDINGTALKYSMNFENLPGGIYSIMIQNGTTIRTKKLVLAR